MEFGTSRQLKVVWICHFSNQKVREKLILTNNYLEKFLRNILDKRSNKYRDFAPWINNLIIEFENFENVELHVIAPHLKMAKNFQEFGISNIHYHFFKPQGEGFLMKLIRHKIIKKKEKNFYRNRKIIQKFIYKIDPDIINLIGAENPYYSIAALDITDTPVYLSCQTIYSNPLRKIHSDSVSEYIWNLELEIHKRINYFGCDGRMYRDLILKNNPNAIIFKMFFAKEYPSGIKHLPKKYDFVFFAAGVTMKKGVEDVIEALALVVKKKSDVSLNIVGSCSIDYKYYLLEKIAGLGLNANISFNDYFSVHSDMHQHITQGRYAVLPIKLDVISSSVIEAISLDIPVVTYETTGTPYLNKDGETVLISEINNIEALAANMIIMLERPEYAKGLSEKAKAFVKKEFDNTTSAKRLLADYYAVLEHYYDKTPIPRELLFSTEEFPIY